MKTRIIILLILITQQYFCQQDYEVQENIQQQQEDFSQYSQHLGDFAPTQSFQFDLSPSQQQTFIFWPPPDIKILRGMFYITSQENKGLFVGLQHQGNIQKTFWDKKIGIFSLPYTGTGDMKIIVKSELKKLLVYLSYQFLTKKKHSQQQEYLNSTETTNNSTQTSQLKSIVEKFSEVKNSVSGQQQVLKSIIRSTLIQGQRIRNEINSKTYRVIIETIVLIVSGIVSLVMLKKQFKKGYQLIV